MSAAARAQNVGVDDARETDDEFGPVTARDRARAPREPEQAQRAAKRRGGNALDDPLRGQSADFGGVNRHVMAGAGENTGGDVEVALGAAAGRIEAARDQR